MEDKYWFDLVHAFVGTTIFGKAAEVQLMEAEKPN